MTMNLKTAFLLGGVLMAWPVLGGGGLPASDFIEGVPWHEQMNGLFCAPGSLGIVSDDHGPDIDQKPIADVARSSLIGTWCDDNRIRAGGARAGWRGGLPAVQPIDLIGGAGSASF